MRPDIPKSQNDHQIIAIERHAILRWMLTIFDEFSTETGLGSDEVIILMSLMMISYADVLRGEAPLWSSRTSLGTLSQMTAIPKETVRRKLKKMSEMALIHAENDSIYTINGNNSAVLKLISGIDKTKILNGI